MIALSIDGVLGQTHDEDDVLLWSQGTDTMHGSDGRCSATLVDVHVLDESRGFEVQPSRVEGETLPHHCEIDVV